ncbi:response regulator transcription factor [Arundinibacter roseus]|uniref:Response regulator transcription factor n=1 Tax=Arundinibacter roseus TaxID=2070510 RepID=A0A4R4JZW0_9BACT|nr:response regulator transcription factor [Arundinibacter roseus]TDB59561.1 response regulator transcription factor [Arundinibacter roseus]
MINIAIVDDNDFILSQFSDFQGSLENIAVLLLAGSIEEFELQLSEVDTIDILFLDINLPNQTGLEALPNLKVLLPDTNIIMFTVHEEEKYLIQAFCNGAVGYLLKDIDMQTLSEYIHIVQKGGSAISAKVAQYIVKLVCEQQTPLKVLNDKEYEVLQLLSEGWSYKLIADRTGLSTDGVRFYIKRIYRALNVNSKGEAIRIFYKGM